MRRVGEEEGRVKVTVENTSSIVELEINGVRVPARLWEGTTETGIPVACFITRISPQTHDAAVNAAFARELQEQRKPTLEPFDRGISYRYIW
jgi:hypothetical protein